MSDDELIACNELKENRAISTVCDHCCAWQLQIFSRQTAHAQYSARNRHHQQIIISISIVIIERTRGIHLYSVKLHADCTYRRTIWSFRPPGSRAPVAATGGISSDVTWHDTMMALVLLPRIGTTSATKANLIYWRLFSNKALTPHLLAKNVTSCCQNKTLCGSRDAMLIYKSPFKMRS